MLNIAWNNTTASFKARVIGKLLGDGGITKQKGRKPRLRFTHAAKDYGWIHYCYGKLKDDIPLNPPMFKKVIDDRLVDGYSLAYDVQSKTSDTITYLRKEWYPNGVKIVPFSLLIKHLTLESLAWWYMDDGHLKINNNIPVKIVLSTESFTDIEILNLVEFIEMKFNLSFSVDGQKRMLLYDQYQIYYFLNLIYPFLHQSMFRKFIPKSSLSNPIAPRRTTIYLPKEINIKQPTREINQALMILDNLFDNFKYGDFYSKYHSTIIYDKSSTQEFNSYQIIINQQNISNLTLLKRNTGLTFSELTELCFKI